MLPATLFERRASAEGSIFGPHLIRVWVLLLIRMGTRQVQFERKVFNGSVMFAWLAPCRTLTWLIKLGSFERRRLRPSLGGLCGEISADSERRSPPRSIHRPRRLCPNVCTMQPQIVHTSCTTNEKVLECGRRPSD